MKNDWSGGEYAIFRALFGVYLFVHFVHLVPWAAELFSSAGALRDGTASPLLRLFPNVLALWDGPAVATGLVVAAAALSILLAGGRFDRPAAVAIWYIWACLHGRMPLIANPGLPYVGWLLLAHAALPALPRGSLRVGLLSVAAAVRHRARGNAPEDGSRPAAPPDGTSAWRMPAGIHHAAWVLLALGYTYSGLTKLVSPSWIDGSAIARVLDNPLARPGVVRDLMMSLPAGALHAATWGALAAEIAFAPLALAPRLRPWLWAAMLAMHLGLVAVLDFADLSLGMVMVHLFTFDPAWVRPRRGAARAFSDRSSETGHSGTSITVSSERAPSASATPSASCRSGRRTRRSTPRRSWRCSQHSDNQTRRFRGRDDVALSLFR